MKTILVSGGAGYIGSHMVALLGRMGYEVVVADNLSTGHREAVKYGKLYVGDIRDGEFLDRVFTENPIEGVINFAAFSLVGESVTDPLKYYGNNVTGAISMLGAMRRHGVDKLVFSSTAATYGEPERQPIREGDPTVPTNPYGETKLAIEKMMKWCDRAYGIRYVAPRYFNAAGADNEAGIGEDHSPETHLIPNVLRAALGEAPVIKVFGDDYPTRDGTCVRDYVDVRDLARGHLLALQYLEKGGESRAINLGTGDGYTVREIIAAAEKVTGRKIPTEFVGRRAGDPSTLVADNAAAAQLLGWRPEKTLEETVQSAWNWHSRRK